MIQPARTYRARARLKPKRRCGATVVMAAVMLVVIIAMVSFAVDIGYIVHVDTELQRTADACAMAAVQRLPDQLTAGLAAQTVAEQNKGIDGPILSLADIQFGRWSRGSASFVPSSSGINAVKVSAERSAANGNPLALFFAPVIGRSDADIVATAICMYDEALCGPLVGIEWITVPGDSSTDSFRSSHGPYALQVPRSNGSLCSDGPIGLEGNSIVRGNANPGRGYQTTLDGASVVTGNTSPRLRPLNLPPVDASPFEFSNHNDSLPDIQKGNNFVSPVSTNGSFLLDAGKTYDMPPGTYYFRDLTLTGQSTLNISGPTTIYLTGDLDTSGGYLINNTQVASNLRILMQGDANSNAIVTSAVDLYAVVYAPDTAVETRGAAAFFGAIVGRTLYVTGTGDVHYDENLELDDVLDLPKRVSLVQ